MKTADINYLAKICTSDEQYFIGEVISAMKEPLRIIDAGAYTGELIQGLNRVGLKLDKCWCFEADENNFRTLVKNADRNIQICVEKGLYDESKQLFFDGSGSAASRIVPYQTECKSKTFGCTGKSKGGTKWLTKF